MSDAVIEKLADVLTKAGAAHGAVYHYVGGDDPDWATFYSDWLVNHSPLGELVGEMPIRSHLTAALLDLDRRYTSQAPGGPWEVYYARDLVRQFGVDRDSG